MKIFSLLIFYSFIIVSSGFSQGCLPDGIEFTNQTSINNFQINYPNCTQIEGFVEIEGDSITNLNGLSSITSIGGYLKIWDCSNLSSLMGLQNLDTIYGALSIHLDHSLTNLSGLNGLRFIGSDLWIFDNNNLASLNGLNQLDSIGGGLNISQNNLVNLNALIGLQKINGMLALTTNSNLTNILGLSNINPSSINNLQIKYNPLLSDCNIQSLCDYIMSPGADVSIELNGPGCNNQDEVSEACLTGFNTDIKTKQDFRIFPNPTGNAPYLYHNINGEYSEITLYNQIGEVVLSQKQFNHRLNISTLKQGMYIFELISNGIIYREKLIID